jgi:hypothetical protein
VSNDDSSTDATSTNLTPEQRLRVEVASLRNQIEHQRARIVDLERPRHWSSKGLIGSQAQAWHESLDTLIARLLKLRSFIRRLTRPGNSSDAAVRLRGGANAAEARFRQVATLLAGDPAAGNEPAMEWFLRAADQSTATADQNTPHGGPKRGPSTGTLRSQTIPLALSCAHASIPLWTATGSVA